MGIDRRDPKADSSRSGFPGGLALLGAGEQQ